MIIKFWEVAAFKKKGPPQLKTSDKKYDYTMLDTVAVQVIAENEKEAMAKAKKTVTRKYYRLNKMWEYLPPHSEPTIGEEAAVASVKMQKKFLDLLKSQND